MQAPMGIPPSFRTNIDYTFLLKNNNTADREKIYKHYAGVFPSREMFDSVMDTCTEDHNCLVIDNTSTSNKLEDQVFFYKAKDNGPFKICSKKIWELNNDKYNQDVSFNNSNSYTTKKNTKLTVKKIK
jgi:hypothetical protein